MSVRLRMTHKAATRLGWRRVDPRPWISLRARWVHVDGWRLEHCGHPTANWPWALYDPRGAMVRTGALQGHPERGLAWRTLTHAMGFVASLGAWT